MGLTFVKKKTNARPRRGGTGTWEENSKGFCDSLSYPVLMVLKGAGEGQPALPT